MTLSGVAGTTQVTTPAGSFPRDSDVTIQVRAGGALLASSVSRTDDTGRAAFTLDPTVSHGAWSKSSVLQISLQS